MPEDERARQVSGVAELAAGAYAAVGADGLYDYLAPEVIANCSKHGLATALASQPVPEGFVRMSFATSRAVSLPAQTRTKFASLFQYLRPNRSHAA